MEESHQITKFKQKSFEYLMPCVHGGDIEMKMIKTDKDHVKIRELILEIQTFGNNFVLFSYPCSGYFHHQCDNESV